MGRKLMEYHIISGAVIETRRSYLPARNVAKKRGCRKAGASSAKKIAANERQEALRLARILNTNFGMSGGYLVSLKYDENRLPQSYDELCENGSKLMRKLSTLCKREGIELKRVLINANFSPKYQRPARLHHHLVINELPLDLLRKLWPEQQLYIRTLERGDLSELASYLLANGHDIGAGKKKWACSKNMDKPVFTEPEEVYELDGIQAPAGASNIVQLPTYDEDGRQIGSYMRCFLSVPPVIKGRRVIIPKPPKRGGHKRKEI